ncbi:hypothetical protein F0562_022410 [Nyssa sinensis]|uniref:Ubiquitinyl hydrolase 1 n=1 Tax=Nyssa sinensis TaxID=561372 RepID=A0A5J5BNN9_9ASTE|nr:hypothetical protein F0562_022410 [Nyssa sinensis]
MTLMIPAPIDQEDDEILVPHSDLVEGPQPMEAVPQTQTGNNLENQPVEDPQISRFTWRIVNFSRLNMKKHYSEIFIVGGYEWRILIFPKGNNVDLLSMYLDVADSTTLPYGWSRYAQFSFTVINQNHNKYSVRQCTQHQFNAEEADWGFTSFMPLGELYDPDRGYLVNDTCIVEAEVSVHKVVDYWTYDSRETGFVGLKNQGATCYMNSLLQTLYHIPCFRKAVYHMPTTVNDNPSGNIALALQSLFCKLQYSDQSVATEELTKSFGWDTNDSFMQHDVQELNRVLCEKLEEKMMGTVVEGTIEWLFEGHHMNYIECINVDYQSTRKESFYDLQLDVKGCCDVYASFDKYVEVECLDGDNKYHSEQYGLQDAKKGVLFIDFPPVLQLHLKRFEYDFMQDTMVKVSDKEPEKPEKGFGSTSSGGDGLSRIGALGGNPTLQISPMKLDGNNYLSCSRACLLSIDAADLHDYVTRTFKEPTSTDPTLKQWRSSNSLVMSWLFNSMQPHISRGFLFLKTAYEIWIVVAQTYSQVGNDAQIYDLRKRVHDTKQKDLSVVEYYADPNDLWRELDHYQNFQAKCPENSVMFQ